MLLEDSLLNFAFEYMRASVFLTNILGGSRYLGLGEVIIYYRTLYICYYIMFDFL